MELIFQMLFELIFEFAGQFLLELLARVLGRSARATHADLFGRGEASWRWRITAYTLMMTIAVSVGIWRGTAAEGSPTFGLWVALGIALLCGAAICARVTVSAEPPPGRWNRLFRWWPRPRLAWFALGNATFAVGYLLAL